ncbi:hypothetical protein PtA15_17A228 [Puccinia triticina]|uniref:Uncharacterized protein n=2 Tax=Puccinia triticina TaxID=208348 RepID=A0ABY7D5U5_9BASI|nr:uncharacterized protein PtA15_17A228 [Puccinia triticina]WAQ92746.1 hypothetical protein PtA15_17A228 [Puccinia triticina]
MALATLALLPAISQIIYDKPNNILDRVSIGLARQSGNCTVIVSNTEKDIVTKKQIEAGFNSILDQCQNHAGQNPLFKMVYVEVQNRQARHDTNFFPPRVLTCGLNRNAPLTADKDCQTLFDSIPVDKQGRLSSTFKTFKTCTILLYTTDDSPLIAKKSDIAPVVSDMIKGCKGKSGVISLTKGASGNNGLAVVKLRSSKLCGDGSDSLQVCL